MGNQLMEPRLNPSKQLGFMYDIFLAKELNSEWLDFDLIGSLSL